MHAGRVALGKSLTRCVPLFPERQAGPDVRAVWTTGELVRGSVGRVTPLLVLRAKPSETPSLGFCSVLPFGWL